MGGAPGTTLDGQTFYRPGVRSRLNGDNLAKGGAAPAGIVAVLGVFERGTPKTPFLCVSPDDVKKKLPTLGARISSLLFEAATDRKVRGRPNSVYLVRVNPATRASATLKDAGAADVLKLYADDYGVYGNQTSYKAEAGTAAGSQKFTFGRGTASEVLDNVLLDVFSLNNADDTEIAALKLIVDPTASTGKVQVTFQSIAFALGSDPDTTTLTKLAFDGLITFTLDQVSGAATTITITGTNKATGSPDTEVLAIGAAALTIQSTKQWSDISTVVVATKGTSTTITISGDAFNLPLADYPTVADVKAKIDTYAGRGFVCTALTGENINITDLDKIAAPGTACQALNTATAKANLFETVHRINRESVLVRAEKVTAGQLPAANVATAFLGGGGEGSTSASDWQTALDNIKAIRCDTVALLSNDSALHAKARAHVRYMEGDGRDERMAFLGAAKDEGLDAIRTRVIALNDRNVVLCGQEIRTYNAKGQAEWLEPMWQALQVAGLFASLRVGVPLTEKIMNVLGVRNAATWDADKDAETVIQRGLLAYYQDKDGFIRILRQVTTYQQDTHEVYALISRNASANRSIKNVRAVLQPYLGDPDVDVDEAFLERKTIDELERQVADKEIKAFDPESVTFTAITNGFKGAYSFVPVGATEFINITGNLVRQQDIAAAA